VTRIGCAPRLAMATEDFRYFELWPQHVRTSLQAPPDRAAPSYRVVGNTPGFAQTGRRPRTHSLAPTSRPKISDRRPRSRTAAARTRTVPAGMVPAGMVPVPDRRCRARDGAGAAPSAGAASRGPEREKASPPDTPAAGFRADRASLAPSTRALTQKPLLPAIELISRPRAAAPPRHRPTGRRRATGSSATHRASHKQVVDLGRTLSLRPPSQKTKLEGVSRIGIPEIAGCRGR
jgi:hypothetical protein